MATQHGPGAAESRRAAAGPPAAAAPLERLVCASRSTCAVGTRATELRRIVEHAQAFNAAHGLSGLLVASQDRYLQVLDGPPNVIEALLRRLQADPRHARFELLARHAVAGATFPGWPMGLVECSEPLDVLDARLAWLKGRLAGGLPLPAGELAHFMIAPGAEPTPPTAAAGDVLLVSPGGLWGPSVLQRAAVGASARVRRSTLWQAPQQQRRAVIEFVDIETRRAGTARVLSVTGDWPSPALLAAALHRLTTVVLLIAPSDLANPQDCAGWLRQLPPAIAGRPLELLIVSSCARERLAEVAASAPPLTAVQFVPLRLSHTEEIWRAVLSHRERGGSAAEPTSVSVSEPESAAAGADAWLRRARPLLGQVLGEGGIGGVCAAAVVDLESTRVLQPPDMPCKDEADLPGLAQFMRDQHRLLLRLAPDDTLREAALLTSHHLLLATVLPAASEPPICLLLALDRGQTTLAAARLHLSQRLAHPGPLQAPDGDPPLNPSAASAAPAP